MIPPASGIPEDLGASSLQSQFTKVVARVSPQVVQIQTSQGLGSGIVYDDRGDIVTNAHVTGTAKKFRVTLAGGDNRNATLVGADPGNDLAVILGNQQAAGIGFAIRIDKVQQVADRLIGSSR